MAFPVDAARQQLESLADKHDVYVVWIQGYNKAVSFPEPRIAALPHPSDGTRYLVALHELGHVVDRRARRWNDRDDLYGTAVCEGFAWAWAAKKADRSFPLSQADWARAGVLLSSYWAIPVPHEPEPVADVPSS